MRERFAQSFERILAPRIGEARAARFIRIDAKAVGDLRHRRDILSIQFVEKIDVAEDRVQIPQHARALRFGQFEIGQVGNVDNVFFGNLHKALTLISRNHERDAQHARAGILIDGRQVARRQRF